jgi:hypothetical protein
MLHWPGVLFDTIPSLDPQAAVAWPAPACQTTPLRQRFRVKQLLAGPLTTSCWFTPAPGSGRKVEDSCVRSGEVERRSAQDGPLGRIEVRGKTIGPKHPASFCAVSVSCLDRALLNSLVLRMAGLWDRAGRIFRRASRRGEKETQQHGRQTRAERREDDWSFGPRAITPRSQ